MATLPVDSHSPTFPALAGPVARQLGYGLVLGLLATGCTIDLGTDGLQEELEGSLESLGEIEVCDGQTLDELMEATTISEECKEEVLDFLPEPENDFESRLVLLGSQDNEDGSVSLFVHAVDENGEALGQDALSGVEVSVEVDGETQVLAKGDFSIRQGGDLRGDLLSIGFVNDYSGSMFESDLQVTAEIEGDLLTVLPPIYEGEVTQFSTEVTLAQSFSTDEDQLLSAVAYDETVERDLTALYDGMDAGLSSLIERPRPLRLLVVATDGQENASEQATKAELVATIEREDVCVLMLGSLFSDPSELADFSSSCGAYFYTRGYADLKGAVSAYVESMGALSEIVIPEDSLGTGSIQLEVDGLSAAVEL